MPSTTSTAERTACAASDLRRVRSELAALEDDFDASELTGHDAGACVHAACEIERLAHAVKVLAAARVDQTRSWSDDGSRSAAHWLAKRSGTSVGEATRTMATARQAAALPATRKRLRQGRLSPAQVRQVAEAADADPAAEGDLLGVVDRLSLRELTDRCRRVKAAARPTDAVSKHQRIQAERYLRSWLDDDGAYNLMGRSTVDDGALIDAALRPIMERRFKEAHATGRREPVEAYWWDALIEVMTEAGLIEDEDDLRDLLTDEDDAHRHDPAAGVDDRRSGEPTGHPSSSNTADRIIRAARANPPAFPVDQIAADGASTSAPTTADALIAEARAKAAHRAAAPPMHRATPTGGPPMRGGGSSSGPPDASDHLQAPSDDAFQPSIEVDQTTFGGVDPDHESGSKGTRRRRRRRSPSGGLGSRAKVIVRIDHTALVRGHVVPGEVCEIEGYGPVPVAVVEAMLPDAFVAAVLTRGHDVTTVAHLGRRATAFQTTALDWSEAGCSTEGCPNVGLRETDHTIEWRRTHHTKLDELRRPCKACHRLRTLEGYTYGARDPVTGKSPLLPPVEEVDPRG